MPPPERSSHSGAQTDEHRLKAIGISVGGRSGGAARTIERRRLKKGHQPAAPDSPRPRSQSAHHYHPNGGFATTFSTKMVIF